MSKTKYFLKVVFLILIICMAPALAPCQTPKTNADQVKIKRLILTDGSYQPVSQYEIKGNRIHYFSSERREWEDLPLSLVDWPATEEFARKETQQAVERMDELQAKAAKARAEEDARQPVVAEGLKLPAEPGIYLLDSYKNQAELYQLSQSGADVNKNMGSNILRGIINPIASSKQTVELKGLHARVQAHTAAPTFYIAVDVDDPAAGDSAESVIKRFRIARCKIQKGNRIVGVVNIAVYGKVKEKTQLVETKAESVSNYWVKISPADPLQNGEYALIELLEKNALNQFVWDFGVNPAAPSNPASKMAGEKKKEPVLIQKPRKPNSGSNFR